MKEIEWRVIPDFPMYSISEYGQIRSSYKTRKILSPKYDKDGYAAVSLSKDKKVYHLRVHRLVAQAFIENPEMYPVVNHKDLDILNNHFTNLEWCTYYHNTVHYYANGIGKRTLSSLIKEEMLQIVEEYKSGKSHKELKEKYNLDCRADAITEIVTGRRFSNTTGIQKLPDFKQRSTAKIDDQTVLDLLDKAINQNIPHKTLCEEYSLSPAQVSRIVNGSRRVDLYNKFMMESYDKKDQNS